MPPLAQPSQKTKGKGKGRKKPPKMVPDPDAAYRQQLDETLYIPKVVRKKFFDTYLAAVDSAIRANTFDKKLLLQDSHSGGPISFTKVPGIFRSLGLCLTDDQLDQITAMIAQNDEQPFQGSGTDSELEEGQWLSNYADREKLRTLSVELLHTHVLAYDPQVLACPHPRFPDRVSSVVYRSTEDDIRACFNSLWEVSGKKTLVSADGTSTRCISVDQLESILMSQQDRDSVTAALTPNEFRELCFMVQDANGDVVREDLFLKAYIHVE
ncbi:hypothetical protein JKF63_07622 [Porcisia hertigi]|uniref:Uncharacterized protein n=1 Tax=Porcisia hertigi TaxID=2761500 RepID=A0A836IIM3_9TRYP|nr:hypothetical protein JKF63_07622 [Porcisia hertigi]